MEIKINNLRNLNFENYFNIKPINVIVGSNSSGKSTFLRFFPLIKQSMEKLTSSPILWYGPYVDYGSFEESINRLDKNGTIDLSFKMKLNARDFSLNSYLLESYFNRSSSIINSKIGLRPYESEFQFDIKVKDDQISSVFISFNENKIELAQEKKSYVIKVNEQRIFDSSKVIFDIDNNLRKVVNIKVSINTNTIEIEKIIDENKELNQYYYRDINLLSILARNLIADELKKIAHGKISKNSLFNLADEFLHLDIFDLKNKMIKYLNEYKDLPSLKKVLLDDDKIMNNICGIILASNINRFIEIMNRNLYEYFMNVDYIAPLRAHAERYYRYQNLSVDSIDPSGENIPTLINSLNEHERNLLNDWLESNFNFTILNNKLEGHNTISICDKNTGSRSNIKDTGFGFSQILPILIQLWMYSRLDSKGKSTTKGSSKNFVHNQFEKSYSKTLIIEQPELHLHPALQAKLIDSICEIISRCNENRCDIRFILETHSETIVNRVHMNIMKGKLKNGSANITIFEQDNNGFSTLRQSKIDENGNVTNWPFGFFQPEV